MSSTTKLLFVDDEEPIRRLFRRAMGQDESVLLETAPDGKIKKYGIEKPQ